MLRLHPGTVDYIIIAIYFAVVLGIGFVARLSIKTDLDFFLSGRSLPAWITGLAFIAANLGALEILGLFGSHTVKNKAAGINVDLWTGLGMLVFGGLMIFWALSRPVMPEPPETRGQGSGRIRRAAAT